MKKIINLSLFLLFFACGNTADQQSKPAKKDYTWTEIDFLESKIPLPNNYEQISANDYRLIVEKANISAKSLVIILSGLSNLEMLTDDFLIFVDKENILNVLFIQLGEYVNFDKDLASLYISMLNEKINNTWSALNIQSKRLQKRYYGKGKSKFIKVKYQLMTEATNVFQTQYVVTSKKQTFMVLVSNENDIDFEKLILSI